MKCLTNAESEEWLALSRASIDRNRDLNFPETAGTERFSILVDLPKKPLSLSYFASALVGWLPKGRTRMLWLKSWETYPPDPLVFFQKARADSGETRTIIEAPGHLFTSTAYADVDSRSPLDRDEEAVMAGLALLMICFDWQGYLLAEKCGDHVMLGDECVLLSSERAEKMHEASTLATKFRLRVRDRTH